VRDALAIGTPTLPQSLAFYALWAGDRAIVQRVSGLAAAGRYQAAYPIGGLGILLVSALNNAWGPMIYGARDEERWPLLADTAHAVYRFAALLAGALALGAPLALLAVVPASYGRHELSQVSALVALAAVPYVGAVANLHVLYWRRRTRPLAWTAVIAAASNLALTAAFLPPFGLRGAALATIVSYSLHALLLRDRARRLARVPFRRWSAAQSLLLAAALVGLALVLPEGGAWLAVRGLAAIALLGACAAIALHTKTQQRVSLWRKPSA
jgi:O-antigen/teichoic acid export membrane protein